MPRGNDSKAALHELTDKFGEGAGRAEDLIKAARERYPEELRKAQNQDVDANATALIDNEEVADAAGVKAGDVQAKAVRGNTVVAVIADEEGRTSKVSLPLSQFSEVAEEVGGEDSSTVLFASDSAEEMAEAKSLTPETITSLIGEGSGKDGSFTKKDVARAAEAKAGAAA